MTVALARLALAPVDKLTALVAQLEWEQAIGWHNVSTPRPFDQLPAHVAAQIRTSARSIR